MSKEEFLREAMARAAGHGEPPVGDAFARFQRKRSRGNFIRGVIVSTSALGVALALFFTLPGLNSHSDSFSVAPINPTLATYVDPIVGFQFDYPASWILEGAPGKTVVVHPQGEYDKTTRCSTCHPQDLESVLQPFVTVTLVRGEPAPSCAPPAGCEIVPDVGAPAAVTMSSRSLDGRYAGVSDLVEPPVSAVAGDPRLVRWCSGCHETRVFVNDWYRGMTGWNLFLALRYPEGYQGTELETARAIIDSFRRYPSAPKP